MIAEGAVAKIIGVLGGAFLALVFVPPRTIAGFLRRLFSAIVFGWLFGGPVRDYLGWAGSDENIAAAFAMAAFFSWWGMGVSTKIAEKFVEKKLD